MLINKALKVRIYPNKVQSEKIDATFGCCRYIYNEMLSRNQKVYQRRGEHLSYIAMQNLLPAVKKYKPWLKDVDSQALQNACRHLDTAYKKFSGTKPVFQSTTGNTVHRAVRLRKYQA